jgi:hypothetical protein
MVAVVAGLAVAFVQNLVEWQGNRAEYLLIAGFNAFLASLATWFFHIRWRLLGDSFDRHVRNVFLPIACHFLLLLALEALLASKDLADAFVGFSWVVSQTLAAAVLLFTFRGGRESGSGRRALRTSAALLFAVAVWAVFYFLSDQGLVRGLSKRRWPASFSSREWFRCWAAASSGNRARCGSASPSSSAPSPT